MSGPGWNVAALLLSVAILGGVELQVVSATHFRYGSISWCKTATPFEVKFEVNLVYKRDYNWGQWYNETWSRDGGASFNNRNPATGTWMQFPNDGTDYIGTTGTRTPWMLRFPTGWGTAGLALASAAFPNRLQCEDPLLYAGVGPTKNASLPCTPWSETVGWFYGDGTYDALVLTVVEVNFESTEIGNYVRGKSAFSHIYPTSAPATGLWTAYFTGGNRLSSLVNNRDGRYRLETTINLESINCSPVATGLPVLPVPFTGRAQNSTYGYMTTFQIAAYDPDVRPGQVGDSDKVSFRVGSRREFGFLLEHSADNTTSDSQWTEAQWNAKVAVLQAQDVAQSKPPRTIFRGSRGELHGVQWDNATDYAHAPSDLVIDANTGIVTWETGINFFVDDTANYMNGTLAPNPPKPRKQSGFYNLVVMISSLAHSTRFPTLQVTIPLDFLMYLYPPMYYCGLGCQKGTGSNLKTFRTSDGLYGDSGNENPAGWIYNATANPGTLAPGTGKCFLCGGGETNTTVLNARSYCAPILPGGVECTGVCPGVRMASDGKWANNSDDCVVQATYQTSTAAPLTIVPAKSVCRMNTPPYWVFGPSDTPPVDITDNYPIKRSVVRVLKGTDAIFNLVARDDDDCVELRIYKLGFYNLENSVMELKQPTRDVLPGGVVGKQVRTRFEWRVNPGAIDDRPVELTICFYAFDNYLLSKFLCVRIQIYQNSPPPPSPPPPSPPPPVAMELLWCDEGVGGFGLKTYSVTGATYEAYLGEETCIPLCIRNPSGTNRTWQLSIMSVTLPGNGSLPSTPFPFPYDETNFPLNGTFNGTQWKNPLRQSYCFVPSKMEECVYTVCFQGFDFFNARRPDRTSIRCYKIEVKNDVLYFPPDQPSALVVPTLGDIIIPKQGLAFSAWVNPSCEVQDVNATILYFNGSDYDVRNGLRWVPELHGGSFAYFDDFAGVIQSPAIYDCDMWHFVAVTITKKNRGFLVVDNVERGRRLLRTSEWYKYSVTEFSTPSRPDDYTGLVLGYKEGEPFVGLIDELRVWGRNLSLSEIRTGLYQRELSSTFEDDLIGYYTMRPEPLDPVPWYQVEPLYWSQRYYRRPPFTGNITDFTLSGLHPLIPVGAPLNATVGIPVTRAGSIPSMIPCVLGMEFPTGPCDGSCKTSVYGWSISKGQMLKCKFGDTEVVAKWRSETEAFCSTPPHFLPAYIPVTMSNDGINFTDPHWIQKKVNHLYLGGGGRGCQALGDEDRITCGLRAVSPGGRARGRFCEHEAGEDDRRK